MTLETEVKQDQTLESGEVKAGEEKEKKVDTAATETDGEQGLQKKDDEFSVDAIMSEEESKLDEVANEKGLSPESQERINRKIGTAIKERNIAQLATKKANAKIAELETVQTAPKERPLAPLREDFEEGQEYQKSMDKYQGDISAFNTAESNKKTQKVMDDERVKTNDARLIIQMEELQKKFSDIDIKETIALVANMGGYGNATRFIEDSEHNGRIALFLAKNPVELAKIANLNDVGAINREIGKLEARFERVKKKTTNAPNALNTIKADTTTEVVDINKIKDTNEWYKAQQNLRLEEANRTVKI